MTSDDFPVPFFITRDTRVKFADVNPLLGSARYGSRFTLPEPKPQYASGSFAIPGRAHSPSIVPTVEFDGDELIFPGQGEYYFYSKHGAYKFLILPHDALHRAVILLTAQFVSRNSVHSLADHWLSYTEEGCPFNVRLLAQKFFNSDQPLQLYCGEITPFLAALLNRLGVATRQVNLFDAGNDGHVVLEAFDPAEKRWLMMDADHGVYVTDGDSRILSVSEFVEHIGNEREVTIVDIAQKRWLTADYAVPSGFFGQKSWRPDCDSDFAPANPQFYRTLWKKWARAIYYDCKFSRDGWCVSYQKIDGRPEFDGQSRGASPD